jgi:hypothetical protein
MSGNRPRRREPGKVISSQGLTLLPSRNDSMKTLPKVDKKISQRVLKHEIGENYIKDKLKMAEETLVVCFVRSNCNLLTSSAWRSLKFFGEN